MAISLVIPSFFYLTPQHGPRYFDLYTKNEEMVPIVGTKRGRDGEL